MRRFAIIAALILSILPWGSSLAKEQEYPVSKVIDGDTILLENGSIVHYIGVNAPQLKGEGGGEFFGREAFRENKSLVLLKKVRLEFDAQKKDEEGRLLAYVFVKDLFVIRLRHAPSPSALEAMNEDFADILLDGKIEVIQPTPEEAEDRDRLDLARIAFNFNRRDYGGVRQLIDVLNSF